MPREKSWSALMNGCACLATALNSGEAMTFWTCFENAYATR